MSLWSYLVDLPISFCVVHSVEADSQFVILIQTYTNVWKNSQFHRKERLILRLSKFEWTFLQQNVHIREDSCRKRWCHFLSKQHKDIGWLAFLGTCISHGKSANCMWKITQKGSSNKFFGRLFGMNEMK